MNSYLSEAGHWYDKEGRPAYRVIGNNGQERKATLRDARKLDLVPSVTTILSISAKPALENWKVDQALTAATTIHKIEGESVDEFKSRAKYEARQIGRLAADRGTEIHAEIERGFVLGERNTSFVSVKSLLDSLYPDEEWVAEDSFCSTLGYGGKIDLYSKSGIFVDFKTKDNLEGKEAKTLAYDDHGMQLSAYAEGMGFSEPTRLSIFIDRADPSVLIHHQWDSASHRRHFDMFYSLLLFWKLSKNYDPARATQ